jgi:hypothetical protein
VTPSPLVRVGFPDRAADSSPFSRFSGRVATISGPPGERDGTTSVEERIILLRAAEPFASLGSVTG